MGNQETVDVAHEAAEIEGIDERGITGEVDGGETCAGARLCACCRA